MKNNDLELELQRIKKVAQSWLSDAYDSATQKEVRALLENDEENLIDAFYKNIEFGTGGVRCKMGVGTNRMNFYTLGLITQGLAHYAQKYFKGEIKVVIAYDTRNQSREFAIATAKIFSANHLTPYVFQEPRPTPELSFAIRHLGCQLGIVITASHNPKEYNGYKVYFEDGGQIVPPWDQAIMDEVAQVTDGAMVKKEGGKIHWLDEKLDEIYFKKIESRLFHTAERKANPPTTPILYSPIHGTGYYSVYPCLQQMGFTQVKLVESQSIPDGNFPTVTSPNPEERAALEIGIKELQKQKLSLLLATDPDSDRLGVVIRENDEIHLLSGNQIGFLLADYLLKNIAPQKPKNGFIVRTIVTSPLIDLIAEKYQLTVHRVLTGFKYIAEIIRQQEGKGKFLFGMEESYGYMVTDFVRDKDAVSASAVWVELFYQLEKEGLTLLQQLDLIYQEFGYFADSLKSVVKEGRSGAEEILAMVATYRNHPPQNIAGIKVAIIRDYQTQKEKNLITQSETPIHLPISNVIQFELVDKSLVTVRPSGTEPKIKYYFSTQEKPTPNLVASKKIAQNKLAKIMAEF